MKPIKKNTAKFMACAGLIIFIALLATNVWFSTTRHKIVQRMQTELEAKKSELINEINKLEAEIAKQKSVTNVRQIAKELNMIQSDKPVEILQADIKQWPQNIQKD